MTSLETLADSRMIHGCGVTVPINKTEDSPRKCFSKDSCMLACVLRQSRFTASYFFINEVTVPPRVSSSTEWYLRHRLLRFSRVESIRLCWSWRSFCVSWKWSYNTDTTFVKKQKSPLFSSSHMLFPPVVYCNDTMKGRTTGAHFLNFSSEMNPWN